MKRKLKKIRKSKQKKGKIKFGPDEPDGLFFDRHFDDKQKGD